MAKIAIQKNLLAQTEQIETAEQLEEVFNNPITFDKSERLVPREI